MLLTDFVVKNQRTPGRYTDDQTKGLHLWVKSNGRRYWIVRYTLNGKRSGLSLGAYPNVSLRQARDRAIAVRNQLIDGVDPQKKRTQTAAPQPIQPVIAFRKFALSYVETMRPKWRNIKHGDQWVSTLQSYAFPVIGDLPLDQIDTHHILQVLQPIWLNKPETASRLRGRIEQILAAAIVHKHRPAFNPASWAGHLAVLLPPSPNSNKHHAALPFKDIHSFMALLRAMDCLSALALEFCILNASRTDEVLKARWDEIRDDLWTIPGKRMKAGKEHQVPLCSRSLEILTIARHRSPSSDYIFSRQGKPMSNMAMLNLAKRLNPEITVHGFRSTFRDWASEEGDYSPELAEMQLAHSIKDKSERAYRRGNLIEKRRLMMEDWTDYCQGTVVKRVVSLVRAHPPETALMAA